MQKIVFSVQELILEKQNILAMKKTRNKAETSLHIGKQPLW